MPHQGLQRQEEPNQTFGGGGVEGVDLGTQTLQNYKFTTNIEYNFGKWQRQPHQPNTQVFSSLHSLSPYTWSYFDTIHPEETSRGTSRGNVLKLPLHFLDLSLVQAHTLRLRNIVHSDFSNTNLVYPELSSTPSLIVCLQISILSIHMVLQPIGSSV